MPFQGRKLFQISSGTKNWEGIFPESGAAGVEFLGWNFLEGGAVGGGGGIIPPDLEIPTQLGGWLKTLD